MKTNSQLLVLIAILSIVGLLMVSLAPQHPASASGSWYVAPGGNDANDCLSPTTACATITAALSKTTYGDTVNLMPGTYSEASGEPFPIIMPPGIHLVGSGRYSTILSAPDYSALIILDGKGQDYSADTTIQDMTIQNADYGIEILSSGTHTNNPILSGLRIQGNHVGIIMDTSVDYSDGGNIAPLITDTLVISSTYTGIIIFAYGPSNPSMVAPDIINSIVQGNGIVGIYITSVGADGIDTIAAPHIIHTHIIDNGDDGIQASPMEFGTVSPAIEQSWIEGNKKNGLFTAMDPTTIINVAITNTVIASNQSSGVYIYDRSDIEPGSLRVINSNIQNNLNYGIYWDSANPAGALEPLVENTILWNPAADDLYSTTAVWTTNEVRYSDIKDGDFNGQSGNFSADPIFWDEYHLSSCSPAIDAGSLSNMPPIDIDGDPRPMGSAPDVGVDEQGLPCLITTNKQVSENQAHPGDTLAYTITLSLTEVVTPFNLTLSDLLPQPLALEPDSLWASTGVISHADRLISWVGKITPSTSIQLGFLADVISTNTIAQNFARVDAGPNGMYRTPTATTTIYLEKRYLSFVNRSLPPRGIYGTVRDEGFPAWGVQIDLRFYNGSSWSTYASLFTGTDGYYSFLNVPSLNPGQYYYVRFQNDFSYNDRLWTWHTKSIGSYIAGSDYHMGDFDLQDIHLLSPVDGQHVNLPVQFQWSTRPATPSDSYELDLYDPYDGDPYFYTQPPLGFVGSYTLTNLPPGFSPGSIYVWEIWVYSPDGGFGVSYNAYVIYFNNQNLGTLPVVNLPPNKMVPDLLDQYGR